MAYATADHIGRIKVNPQTKKEGFVLASGDVIYSHTLCGILAADGTLVNLNGNEDAVSAILYADEHLEVGVFNARTASADPYAPQVEAIYDVVVYLNGPAAEFAPGDEGADVFLLDDNTVTLTDAGDGSTPYVGKLQKVISADYAAVYVPGLMRD